MMSCASPFGVLNLSSCLSHTRVASFSYTIIGSARYSVLGVMSWRDLGMNAFYNGRPNFFVDFKKLKLG